MNPIYIALNTAYNSSLITKGTPTPLITIILTLIVVGFILWLINTFIPMAGSIKSILNFVLVVAVILWLLYGLGIISQSGNVSLPEIK